jgi:hypothetical protein
MYPIDNFSSVSPERFQELKTRLLGQTSIKHALDWFLGMNPPVPPIDCLPQDEFSHDLLFPHPGGFWIVYECT